MQIIEVDTPALEEAFIQVAVTIYAKDPIWVRPWDHDIKEVFDPQKNKQFRHGSCIRWILKDDQGNLIGRVAAFINKRTASDNKTGGLGFFECINDQNASNLLMDTCKNWLQNQGMEAMDGPINFGDRDKWWGLLVDGFIHPTYGMNFNPPYYQQLFENYGFRNYFEQYVYRYMVSQAVPEKFGIKAERLSKDPRYRFDYLQKKNLDLYATYFHEVYNAAWGGHVGFKPMALDQAKKVLKTIKPIMDPKLIWFGFYDDKPISFFVMLPELNQVVSKLNGQFGWWQKLKFIYLLKFTKTVNKMYGVIFGVIPEFQGKGVEGGIIKAAEKVIQPMNKYQEMQMNWIGSFNPKMIGIVESLNTEKVKTLVTYRYLFDRNAPFVPHPTI